MNLDHFQFVASPINTAVDAVIARLEALTDENGLKVFQSVEYGLDIPTKTIHDTATPAVRVWQDSDSSNMEASTFFVGHMESLLSIYVYLYAPPINNTYPDIQKKRTEIVKFLLRGLEYPDDNSTGFTPANSWWFKTPQRVEVDHTAPFRRVSSNIDVLPPWYVTRIDLRIEVKNYP